MEKRLIIMKFGGASLGTGERIRAAAKIAAYYAIDNRIVVIVSAVQGVTDSLVSLWQKCQQNQFEEASDALCNLFEQHRKILIELGLKKRKTVSIEKDIQNLFGSLAFHLMTSKKNFQGAYDSAVSFGERCSAYLFAAALEREKGKSKPIDSTNCIITSEHFGNASVLLEDTKKNSQQAILPLLDKNYIPVVTGFFGGTKNKQVAILGRGGSDYSATILAYALDAREVILWKEVDGVFDSDPKQNTNAKLYTELSYEHALSLAEQGAKILHKDAMKPVKAKNIPVWVKNVFRPNDQGTKIWKGIYENN